MIAANMGRRGFSCMPKYAVLGKGALFLYTIEVLYVATKLKQFTNSAMLYDIMTIVVNNSHTM